MRKVLGLMLFATPVNIRIGKVKPGTAAGCFASATGSLISHRLDATDKQKHRAQRHGVEWGCCVFASSLYSCDGAIGSVISRYDYYKSACCM